MHANNFQSNMQNDLKGLKKSGKLCKKKGLNYLFTLQNYEIVTMYNDIQSFYEISLEND